MFPSLTAVLIIMLICAGIVYVVRNLFVINIYPTYLSGVLILILIGGFIAGFQQNWRDMLAAISAILFFPLRPLGLGIFMLIGAFISIGKDKKISDLGRNQLLASLVIFIFLSMPFVAGILEDTIHAQAEPTGQILVSDRHQPVTIVIVIPPANSSSSPISPQFTSRYLSNDNEMITLIEYHQYQDLIVTSPLIPAAYRPKNSFQVRNAAFGILNFLPSAQGLAETTAAIDGIFTMIINDLTGFVSGK